MSFSWPWQSNGSRIQDLQAEDLAARAISVLQKMGRTTLSARLVYRALELDPYQPQSLMMLSDFFRVKTKTGRPTGDEIFAGIILEYAVGQKSTLSTEARRVIDKARQDILNQWGFVKTRGTEVDVDHLGYMTYINELMTKVQSVTNAFHLAMLKLGVQAGVLDPTRGTTNQAYKEWLKSDISTLQRGG